MITVQGGGPLAGPTTKSEAFATSVIAPVDPAIVQAVKIGALHHPAADAGAGVLVGSTAAPAGVIIGSILQTPSVIAPVDPAIFQAVKIGALHHPAADAGAGILVGSTTAPAGVIIGSIFQAPDAPATNPDITVDLTGGLHHTSDDDTV